MTNAHVATLIGLQPRFIHRLHHRRRNINARRHKILINRVRGACDYRGAQTCEMDLYFKHVNYFFTISRFGNMDEECIRT